MLGCVEPCLCDDVIIVIGSLIDRLVRRKKELQHIHMYPERSIDHQFFMWYISQVFFLFFNISPNKKNSRVIMYRTNNERIIEKIN